ncbi:MAG TPA: SDR family NAD(P)-dependent oxidoreductase [Alphaproteobacteria bacterium]
MATHLPLYNKVVLINDGLHGNGGAIAKQLARKGALIAVSYTSSADKAHQIVKDIRNMGGKAEAFQANRHDATEIAALVRHVVFEYGTLDILVDSTGAQLHGVNDNDDGEIDMGAAVDFLINSPGGFIMGPSLTTTNSNLAV